ncbi:lysine transporter LysE [Streptomyces sp. NPDC055103]
MAGRVKEFLKETVGEFVGEAVLEITACLLLIGLVALAVWGWSVSPPLTGGAAGTLALLAGYGAWETFRGPARRRRGRLAAFAVGAFGCVALFAYFASGCSC